MSTLTDAQRRAVETPGNVLVVAGAGTGKTTTLVNRCVAKIIHERCPLDRILMVTFTDAAAAEMRHRIALELENQRAAASGLPLHEPQGRATMSSSRRTPHANPETVVAMERRRVEDNVALPSRPGSGVQSASIASANSLPVEGRGIEGERWERKERPDSRADLSNHLAEQIVLLDTAAISTLSSFCLELVREHFHELELDPQVSVLDDEKTRPLIEKTLDELFGEIYEAADARADSVRALIRQYGNGSDYAIRALVLKIHRYTQTLANPSAWLREQQEYFSATAADRWREWLVEGAREWRAFWLPALESLASETPAISDCATKLRALGESPSLDEFFAALECVRGIDEDNGRWNRQKTSRRPPVARFFEEAEFLRTLRPANAQDRLQQDWDSVRTAMLTLLELAHEFTQQFTAAKRDLGGVDFADIEQLALALLLGPDRNSPTHVAHELRAHFEHVFVDEYQDINEAQDAILRAVSRDEKSEVRNSKSGLPGNRFLVGDVKQSIYRFRLAQPKIFTDYDAQWSAGNGNGARVPLAENFRSREGILNFVNPLFSALMRRSVGGLDYGTDARLTFGAREQRQHLTTINDSHAPRVELHLMRKAAGNDEADSNGEPDSDLLDLEAIEREARLIALRLRELRDGKHLVHEKRGSERPVEYRDMVVLMRSPSDRVEAFAKQFYLAGVPLRAARAGFYEASEIGDLLCLLRLLDNPLQDIPLLAVLRSPLAGLSLEELVEVRARVGNDGWWPALHRFRVKNAQQEFATTASAAATAWTKVDAFLRQFEKWRGQILQGSLSQCLEAALIDTHYEAILSADPRGAERIANVRRLIDLSRDYDPYRRQGLYRFLRFIDAQQEAEVDSAPAPAQAGNAVQLMSIHRSKGLEFPVVVLANIGGTFNERHLNEAVLLSEPFGLCPKVCPPDRNIIYPSLPHWLGKRAERCELLGEEMRLLYVALTRARDTLILTGTAIRNDTAERGRSPSAALNDAEILKARSYLDWLRLWLPQVTRDTDWTDESHGCNELLRWTLYGADDSSLTLKSHAPERGRSPSAASEALAPQVSFHLADVRSRIEWQYEFSAATQIAAKSSVSALRRVADADEDSNAECGMRNVEFGIPHFALRTSHSSLRTSALSATGIGTAYHLFQQFVALDHADRLEDLQTEADRLVRCGVLTPVEQAALELDRLHAFWRSETGRLIVANHQHVERELPFTARFTPAELTALGLPAGEIVDDFIVVQGVADLVVLGPEIWLLDFKTDNVTGEDAAERARHYTPQLAVYATALERIYSRPVTRRWLHFFAAGKTVEV